MTYKDVNKVTREGFDVLYTLNELYDPFHFDFEKLKKPAIDQQILDNLHTSSCGLSPEIRLLGLLSEMAFVRTHCKKCKYCNKYLPSNNKLHQHLRDNPTHVV